MSALTLLSLLILSLLLYTRGLSSLRSSCVIFHNFRTHPPWVSSLHGARPTSISKSFPNRVLLLLYIRYIRCYCISAAPRNRYYCIVTCRSFIRWPVIRFSIALKVFTRPVIMVSACACAFPYRVRVFIVVMVIKMLNITYIVMLLIIIICTR